MRNEGCKVVRVVRVHGAALAAVLVDGVLAYLVRASFVAEVANLRSGVIVVRLTNTGRHFYQDGSQMVSYP